MPEIGRIQSTNFQSLLTELGITRNQIPFALRSEVMPVVLVGGTVSFIASPTPAYAVTDIFTAGVQTAPAAGFVLADTGPLPGGTYAVQAILAPGEANRLDFQWRDAGNALNLWTMSVHIGDATQVRLVVYNFRLNVLNDNERFRVLNNSAGNVGIEYQASILAKI